MAKFVKDQRVVFLDREKRGFPSWFHAGSWGDNALVMHLNARDENGKIKPITGTISRVHCVDRAGNVTYSFLPDGWPQDNHGFVGLLLDEDYFTPLLTDVVMPGTITDRMGNKTQYAT